MLQPPDSSEAGAGSPAKGARAGSELSSQVMLAEYTTLRAEMDRRANVQWNVFALQMGSAGVIASLAISHVSDIALLLLIPLLSYMLGSRYLLHQEHINLISDYVRTSLSDRLQGQLQWEAWKKAQFTQDERRHRWLTAMGFRHPDRLAFEGVASLALTAAAFAAAYAWRNGAPEWYLILGFALLWALGALATYFLHRYADILVAKDASAATATAARKA